MSFDIQSYFDSLPADVLEIKVFNKGLTYLPDLTRFTHLQILDCYNNQLTVLPRLPSTLLELYCYNNKLYVLPHLPSTLQRLHYNNNPQLVYRQLTVQYINHTNAILLKCKFIFYSLKFKQKFRDWLWDKIRRPKIERDYHPNKIRKLLEQGIEILDLDKYL